MPFVLSGTGSRSLAVNGEWDLVKAWLVQYLEKGKKKFGSELHILSGGAEGFDECLFWAGKEVGLYSILALPNPGYLAYYYAAAHTMSGRDRLGDAKRMKEAADQIVHVCQSVYVGGKHANFIRNEYMVAHSNHMLVYQPTSSGTRHCLEEIKRVGRTHLVLTVS